MVVDRAMVTMAAIGLMNPPVGPVGVVHGRASQGGPHWTRHRMVRSRPVMLSGKPVPVGDFRPTFALLLLRV
jgi:hypothetical protein